MESDVVLISAVQKRQEELYLFALETLEQAIERKKEILCFLELEEPKIQFYRNKCEQYGIKYYFYEKVSKEKSMVDCECQIHKFEVPVFYIAELIPDCDRYEVFLNLVFKLQERQLRVLAISEEVYNVIWNLKVIKFWNRESPEKLIRTINEQVYQFYKEVLPDIILIDLPLPILKYDDKDTFDFGITNYAVSQAVPGDAAVLCTYTGTPFWGFWDSVNNNTICKLGYSMAAIHISNKKIDYTTTDHLSLYQCSQESVHQEIQILNKNNNLRFYNLLQDTDCKELCNYMLQEYLDFRFGVINV